MNRQARLFAIAEYLRGRRTGVIADELAERFHVTVRTIYRDLDDLRDAALPLKSEQGRGGGYALDKHYALPPINLTPREAAMLLTVVEYAVKLRVLPFVDTLASGADKVRSALSVSSQRELLGLLQRLRFTGVPALETRRAVRDAVEQALIANAPLRLGFRRADGSLSERTVTVDSVVLERSHSLLNVVDVETGERRQYPMDKVERAQVVPLGEKSRSGG
jgi:predicted DNA-binding transcriptional regulator YafY